MSAVRSSSLRVLAGRLSAISAALGVLFVLSAAPAGAASLSSETAIARLHSAVLEAQIDPEGHDTTCRVQYVSEGEYKQTGWSGVSSVACSPEDLGSGSSVVAVTVALSGLELSTTYRYRFVTTSGAGTVSGPEESFATFGVERFVFEALTVPTSFGVKGEPFGQEPVVQAGGHPFELTTYIAENTTPYEGAPSPDAVIKDAIAQLPAGLIGNPTAMSRCPGRLAEENRCTAASEVGTITAYSRGKLQGFGPKPLFDVVPPEGVAARFAGQINLSTDGYIDASVRSGSDYGVTAGGYNITELSNPIGFKIVLWGVPNEASHDAERLCFKESGGGYNPGCAAEGPERPFLSMPTSCDGPRTATASLDSYAAPGEYVSGSVQMPAITGCGEVPFAPTITTQPTSTVADSATGLNVDLHVPQEEDPAKTSTADLKDAVVTLPAGVAVDPSSADGLEACSQAQAGFTGSFAELNPTGEPGVKTPQFTPGPADCPEGSKLGTVEIDTPLLEHPLPGGLYLARQDENPFGSLLAVYLTVYDPISGVVVKLPGKVETCESTGQKLEDGATCGAPGELSTVFDQNPQLPFEDLKVDLFPGPRAALTTPLVCGSYMTSTVLEPWSHKPAAGEPQGTPDATPSSEPFTIGEAPAGNKCANSENEAPNTPGFEAGTASPIAGSYSPFVLKLSREDGSQHFAALNVTLPSGLVGKIAGIQQCPQADIEAAQDRDHEGEGIMEQSSPSCPSGSEVGIVHVGAGSGAPYYVTGHAYFAGPYEGAPFSLVIVTPAVAGPFDLGSVVVRAGLYINPSTAQVSVKSDPFPRILDGIPLDIRRIDVEITRPDFTLNPTNCDVMSIDGEETSTTGQTVGLSDRFQAGGCTTLPFHPSFAVSTDGVTSRKEGASLTVNVASSPGQANIAKVHVELPKQLPARDDTLKLACTEAIFAANPAACPEGSRVGTATAVTPLLNTPLTGPAYLVSHGGAAFPDLEVVLQGEGVTIILDGKTNIDEKTGITSSTFQSVPDAPISTFTMTLPQGPHSLLAAPEGLCNLTRTVTVKEKLPVKTKSKKHGHIEKRTITRNITKKIAVTLTIPTTLTGQNGATTNQNTPIAITGCPTIETKTATEKHKQQKHGVKSKDRKASGRRKK